MFELYAVLALVAVVLVLVIVITLHRNRDMTADGDPFDISLNEPRTEESDRQPGEESHRQR